MSLFTDVESESQTELAGSAAFSPVTSDTCQKLIFVQLTVQGNTSAPLSFVCKRLKVIIELQSSASGMEK